MRPGVGARVGALLAFGLVLAACEFVLPPRPSAPPSIPDIDLPDMPQADFMTGRASIVLGDGSSAELSRVEAGSGFDPAAGAEAAWTDDAGWGLRLMVPLDGLGDGSGTSVQITREVDGVDWAATADDCDVTIDLAGNAGLRGSAVCSGMAWQVRGGDAGTGPPGEDGFEAQITFEAAPRI